MTLLEVLFTAMMVLMAVAVVAEAVRVTKWLR